MKHPTSKPKLVVIKRPPSVGEETLALHLKARKIPFIREYKFMEGRRFRFDFVIANTHYAIEIEGGHPGKSRHTSYKGFAADAEKYNLATALGWKLLRFTTKMVKDGTAIQTIERVLSNANPMPTLPQSPQP